MKTNKKFRKSNFGFSSESRKIKDRIITVMVFSIVAFIAILLVSEIG